MVLMSMGKNVITTMTAAFEGQSKPNHITMIGAMPTTGTALTRLPSGKSPRCRNGTRSISTAVMKPRLQPAAQPAMTAFRKVWRKSPHSNAAWLAS